MRPSPFLTAVGAGAGTFVALGGTTFVVSGIALSITKRVVAARKAKVAQPCSVCNATGFLDCQVCMGKGILRSRPPQRLKQLKKSWLKPGGNQGGSSAAPVLCTCPACGTTRLQRCLNCLGEGRVCPPD